MATDFYSVLGVPRDASEGQIKKAYRQLARKHHPDVNPGDQAAEERFKEVTAAFEVLKDPRKRKLYDELGDDAIRLGFDEKRAQDYRAYRSARRGRPGTPGGHPGGDFDFGGFGTGGLDLDDILEMLGRAGGGFGGAGGPVGGMGGPWGGGVRRAIPGDDFTTSVRLTLREAATGTERSLEVARPDGSRQRLTVKIPPGVSTGSKVRLAGQGAPGRGGGPAGDLYVETEVVPHPVLRREGDDLHLPLPITVGEAMLGTEIRVFTFEGDVTVRIPPGSQSGRKMRLRGKGVPSLRGGGRGDLYLELRVVVPPGDSDELRAAAETLEGAYSEDVRAELRAQLDPV